MNKLVSKNPVLRFKQGKKLLKFEKGGLNNYKERFPGERTFYRIFTPRNIALGALKAISLKNTIGKKIINNITIPAYKGVYNAVTNSLLTPQLISQTTSSSTSKKSDLKLSTVGGGSSKGNMFLVQLKQSPSAREKVVTPIDNYYVKGFGGNGLKEEIAKLGGVRAMLNKLIRLGLLNDRFGADGKWGKNTQAAYEAYKKIAFNPQTIPAEEPIEKTPNYMDNPINNSQVDLAGIAKQYLYAKQGGQLPFRNPVKRFKRNFRLVAQ